MECLRGPIQQWPPLELCWWQWLRQQPVRWAPPPPKRPAGPPWLSALVGRLRSDFHHLTPQGAAFAGSAAGHPVSTRAVHIIRCCPSEALAAAVGEASEAICQQPFAHLDKPGCGVMNTFVHGVEQGLSRVAAAAQQLLVEGFAGTVVTDRCCACSWLPLEQRWSLIGTVPAARSIASSCRSTAGRPAGG